MSDDEDGVLIPFPRGQFEREQGAKEAALDELPVRTKRNRGCDHERHGSWVNPLARTVTCRGCGVDLDPIEVIATLARRRESLVHQGRSLRREVDLLTERVERLRKDEANAKARIRTARKKRDDLDALIVAAQAGVAFDSYRQWDSLNDHQREVVIGKVRRVVEAYLGALADDGERRTA